MSVYIELLILMVVVLSGYGLSYFCAPQGQDHFYHPRMIEAIRKNRHRLVSEHPAIAYEPNFAYPQLLHWILSFFPTRQGQKLAVYQLYFFSIAHVFGLYWLTNSIIQSVESSVSAGFILALLFSITPFHFAGWNSKIAGFSARSLGLFLGFLFQVLIFFSQQEGFHPVLVYGGLAFIVFLTLLSSQFAAQFILLTSIYYAAVFFSWPIILVVLLGIGIFLLVTGKVGLQFFKGQLAHKTLYFKYLYETNILRHRRYIYRDLVWDVWRFLKNKPIDNIPYALYNPVVAIILLMPFTAVLFWLSYAQGSLGLTSKIALGGYVLFFLTSFKRTRFLGEPERYVEMSYPFVALGAFVLLFDEFNGLGQMAYFLAAIATYSSGLILVQLMFTLREKRNKQAKSGLLNEQLGAFFETKPSGTYIAVNDTRLLDFMLDSPHKVLRPMLSSSSFAGHDFEDLFDFENFRVLSAPSLRKILSALPFDYLVVDHRAMPDDDFRKLMLNLENPETCPFDGESYITVHKLKAVKESN